MLPELTQMYIVCAAIGSIFLIVCAAMGGMHHGHVGGHAGGGHLGGGHLGGGHLGAHAGGGHLNVGHAGHAGHAGGNLGGHAAGHAGAGAAHGHAVSAHGAAGHGAGAHGSAAAHSAGDNEAVPAKLQASTGPFHVSHPGESGLIEAIMGIINPATACVFLAFFGLTGAFCALTFPGMGMFSLAPAFAAGLIARRSMTAMMSFLLTHLENSSAATVEDLIGHMAEVTVPITVGRTGEITYIAKSKRFTAPARANQPGLEIKKGTKVLITEAGDKYMLVDLWTDSFTDPAFDDLTLTPQEKQLKMQSDYSNN